MNMARAKQSDFEAVDRLESVIACMTENHVFPSEIDDESVPRDDINERLGEFVKDWWEQYSASWFRVVFGAKTAIENACDPDSDILEFKTLYLHATDLLDACKLLLEECAKQSGKPTKAGGSVDRAQVAARAVIALAEPKKKKKGKK